MGNVQVRLPDDLQDEIDSLARELASSRSDAIRTILQEGVSSLRLNQALDRYAAGDISLERGARLARVGLHRFARLAADRGIPYLRHSTDEADEDLRSLKQSQREKST